MMLGQVRNQDGDVQDLRHAGAAERVVLAGANVRVTTPPGVAHLFEFLQDTELLEWWDCPYESWFYEPYRRRIREAASKA